MGTMDWAPTQAGSPEEKPAGTSYAQQYLQAMQATKPKGTAPEGMAFSGGDTPVGATTLPAAPAARPAPDLSEYENMPWTEVGTRAFENIGPSALRAGKGLWHAVSNPGETAGTIGNIGKGLYSKAEGVFVDRTPEEQAAADERERTVDAIGQQYRDTYGSMAGFKRTLAEDPVAIGMDAASVLPVVGGAAKTAGLTKTATALGKAGNLVDPVALAAKTVAVPVNAAKSVLKGGAGKASGVGKPALDIAEQAGRIADPAARTAYLTYARKSGDIGEVADDAVRAVDEMRQAASDAYLKDAAHIRASSAELPMTSILAKMDDLENFVGKEGRFAYALKDLANLKRSIYATATSRRPGARTMADLDILKQSVSDLAQQYRNTRFSGKIGELAAEIRNTIAAHDSTYAKMMDKWQAWRDHMLNLKPVVGTDKIGDAARVAKLLKAMKTPEGRAILADLERTAPGKNLTYKLAGVLTSEMFPGRMEGILDLLGTGLLYGMSGHPTAALPLLGASPKLMGMASYGTGAAGRYGDKAAGVVNAPVRNALTDIGNLQQDEQPQGFKAGGKVGINHGAIADRLIIAAERAKKGLGRATEPLLNQPDEAIAKALDIANRSI